MKLDAAASRGVRKDFYDLYFIAQQMPLDELLERAKEKIRWFAILAPWFWKR